MVDLIAVQQSAALPYSYRNGRIELLLITSSGTGRWIIPKGHIEPGLTPAESAEAEALEEAGVIGKLSARSIGSYLYSKRPERGGDRCRVKVFALEVTRVLDDYPEAGQRARRWMSVSKAVKAVQEPGLKALLEKFAKSCQNAAKTNACLSRTARALSPRRRQ